MSIRSFFVTLSLLAVTGVAHADYGWWDFIGVNPPNTVGKYPNAETACRAAVAKIWYQGEKKYTSYNMSLSGDYATCNVELKACSTCQWVVPNPSYWIDGSTIAAIRKGTPCSAGKSYNPKTGECFIDQGSKQGVPPSTCATPSDKKGNPISISSGNKFQRETYFQGGGQFPIKLELVYNGIDKQWRHSYSTKLQETSNAMVVIFADGRSASFDKQTGQSLSGGELSRLVREDNSWTLQVINNEKLAFNSAGRLERWSNQQGETIDIAYEDLKFIRYSYAGKNYEYLSQFISVKSKTQEMRFEERDQAKIYSALIGERQYYFTWDSTYTRLSKASAQLTQGGALETRQYHYDSPYGVQLLTGITDERGIRYASWAYDTQGRAISSEHAYGVEKTLVSYNSDGSSTVTNALGKQATYRFAEFDGVKRITSIQGEPSANCPNSNSTFTYDSRGLLKTKTDNKGHLTTYTYNTRGLEISRTEASGTAQARTITTEWHPTLFLPLTVSEPSRITTYSYDAQGRQLSQAVTPR